MATDPRTDTARLDSTRADSARPDSARMTPPASPRRRRGLIWIGLLVVAVAVVLALAVY
ncbi:hypothetical protein [uncultured Tistrella sp.]|uniref:hypothetical protein n=1 Tax=Tistrella mobilis TaxID=171437 RepID=UPI00260243E8|nr:hypothetical protein [uncultured Tistrella sp.]